MSWVSAADEAILSGRQQVRVHFAQRCLTNPSNDQISQALAQIPSAQSVADLSGDITATLLNPLSILTQFYVATINPVDGVQAGQVRNDVLTALNSLAQSSGISCSDFTIGLVEYDDGASTVATAVCGPGGCGSGFKFATGSLGLVAFAVLAVVVLILVKVK